MNDEIIFAKEFEDDPGEMLERLVKYGYNPTASELVEFLQRLPEEIRNDPSGDITLWVDNLAHNMEIERIKPEEDVPLNCSSIVSLVNSTKLAILMGMRVSAENLGVVLPIGKALFYVDLTSEDSFQFDSSYDWAMTLVEFIENINMVDGTTLSVTVGPGFYCHIQEDSGEGFSYGGSSKIDSIYGCCVIFADWALKNTDLWSSGK